MAIGLAVSLRIRRVPYVLQTHGMLGAPQSRLRKLFDNLFIQPALRRSAALIALTPAEADELRVLVPDGHVVVVAFNTIALPAAAPTLAPPTTPFEVLFLARLHERKQPLLFVEAAAQLVGRHPDIRFTLVGPDEGEGTAIKERLARLNAPTVTVEGPVETDRVLDRFAGTYIYALPARDEPFGLTVLEALACGVPVIINESAQLSEWIVANECGVAFDGSVSGLARAMETYLTDPTLRDRHMRNAIEAIEKWQRENDPDRTLGPIYAACATSS